MAKKRNAAKLGGGPYLASAVFCDNIVEGSDRTLSVIRIIDHVTIRIPKDAPSDVPSEGQLLPFSTWSLLSFKTGSSKSAHSLRLVMNSPTGKKETLWENKRVEFRPEPHGGFNLRLNVGMLVNKAGLFWMDVILDGQTVTRMPLQVSVERADLETPRAVQSPSKTKR